VNLKCTYAQQKPWTKCSSRPQKVLNSNATPKHTPQWKVKTWWRPSKLPKPQILIHKMKGRNNDEKKKPQTNHKLNLGNQRIEDQTWSATWTCNTRIVHVVWIWFLTFKTNFIQCSSKFGQKPYFSLPPPKHIIIVKWHFTFVKM